MTAGIKGNVNSEGMTRIPLVEDTLIVSPTAHDLHVQTVVVYKLSLDTGSLDCLTTGVTAGHCHKVLATRVRTETPNPATQSRPDDVRTGRTTHAN